MKLSIALMLLLLFILAGCNKESGNMKDVSFKTEDNIEIKATHYPGHGDNVILLHMLSRNRNDWRDFAVKSNEYDYNVLAIDMRGHGESELDFSKFGVKEFNSMVNDVKAASVYLEKDSKGKELFVIGASIGANIALNYASENKVAGIVLLSPGQNYRGVETYDAMRKYNGAVLIVASEDDLQSINASQQLYGMSEGDKDIKIYKNAGHGTNMLISEKSLTDDIIDWLNDHA